MTLCIESAPEDEWIFVTDLVAGKTMDRSHVDWSEVTPTINLDHDATVDLVGIVKGDIDGSWGDVG